MKERGVLLGGTIALALHRHRMDDNGTFERLGITKNLLKRLDVMPVHRTDIRDAEALEKGRARKHELLE